MFDSELPGRLKLRVRGGPGEAVARLLRRESVGENNSRDTPEMPGAISPQGHCLAIIGIASRWFELFKSEKSAHSTILLLSWITPVVFKPFGECVFVILVASTALVGIVGMVYDTQAAVSK